MKTIPLTQGYIALVDDCDYTVLAAFKWYAAIARGNVYAVRNGERSRTGNQTRVAMHRVILGLTDPTVFTDHHFHYKWGVDNRRINLRVCTPSQNAANRRRRSDNTSGFKGVSWYKKYEKWMAYAMVDGKLKNLGYYDSKIEAARAYNRATVKTFGEFALMNRAS